MKGKMKSLYGIYKKHGREAFLDAAKSYSAHVSDTIEDTLAEMEAEKMITDYNNGLTALNEQELFPVLTAQPKMSGVRIDIQTQNFTN